MKRRLWSGRLCQRSLLSRRLCGAPGRNARTGAAPLAWDRAAAGPLPRSVSALARHLHGSAAQEQGSPHRPRAVGAVGEPRKRLVVPGKSERVAVDVTELGHGFPEAALAEQEGRERVASPRQFRVAHSRSGVLQPRRRPGQQIDLEELPDLPVLPELAQRLDINPAGLMPGSDSSSAPATARSSSVGRSAPTTARHRQSPLRFPCQNLRTSVGDDARCGR